MTPTTSLTVYWQTQAPVSDANKATIASGLQGLLTSSVVLSWSSQEIATGAGATAVSTMLTVHWDSSMGGSLTSGGEVSAAARASTQSAIVALLDGTAQFNWMTAG